VLVADVVKDSPADKAGLASGDILTEFDGKKVDAPQDLQRIVAVTTPGKGVPIKVWRDKNEKSLEIKIGETPEETAQATEPGGKGKSLLGLDARPLTPEIAASSTCARPKAWWWRGWTRIARPPSGPAARRRHPRGQSPARSLHPGLRAGDAGAEGGRPRDGAAPARAAIPLRGVLRRQGLTV